MRKKRPRPSSNKTGHARRPDSGPRRVRKQPVVRKRPLSIKRLSEQDRLRINPLASHSVTGPTVVRIEPGRHLTVLGTAHISRQSVEDVENFITMNRPDLVCVELCESRYNAISDPDRWRRLDIMQVIKQRKLFLLMSSLILSSFQKKMGEETKVPPGHEIVTAIRLAKERKIPVALVDRDIQVTLRRAWQSVGMFQKLFIISELIVSLFFSVDTDEQQIEDMKNKDMLEGLFENLPPRYHKIKHILITERDMYLAQKINDAMKEHPRSGNIFAVVGAGHLKGIKHYLGEKTDTAALEVVKNKSKVLGFIKFFAPVLVLMGLIFYFSDGHWSKAKDNLIAWSVIKAACSGFFALLFMAHPLATLSAMLTAPISNFNPVLKPGWVAALLEARFHKPSVADFENIGHDTETIRGFFKNKVIRIFMIFMMPQIGSSIGTGLALWYISNL